MIVQRSVCPSAVIGSKVYCIGGRDSHHNNLNSCEVYCRKLKTWTSIASRPGKYTFW